MDGACSTHGEMKPADRILVRKPERKRQHGNSVHRWENNIKMVLIKTM
jgi:hypothetical protein